MAIKHPFKVRKNQHADAVEFKAEMPSSVEDTDLIVKRYGSVDRMIDRANAQWTVDVAPGIRKRLPDTKVAQGYADGYCDNGSRDTWVQPQITPEQMEEQDFDEGQLTFLKAKGMIA
ncbi:hypothetical protein LCGC14_0251710 [marine sediment metagenome]|uniref:Uncharacterized protein n=1 Tax=marine sediment metagenome TaxID=412755 RepID=A0A0F9U913_9ZZZZ